jgi:2-polyprenyl-3-methyl-5-hydroxy-6-metoxy-1,4-benzoquinol methylase
MMMRSYMNAFRSRTFSLSVRKQATHSPPPCMLVAHPCHARASREAFDMTKQPPGPLTPDFDSDPGRFAANQAATRLFSAAGDVHGPVADRLAALGSGRVLDLGGGNGTLARLLARHRVPAVVMDRAE